MNDPDLEQLRRWCDDHAERAPDIIAAWWAVQDAVNLLNHLLKEISEEVT